MKKYIAIISMFAVGFAFADDENYDGKSVSEDFSGKSMNYSSWVGATVNSNFIGTKLKESNFEKSNVVGSNFSGANLTNSIFDNAKIVAEKSANFENTIIKGASFKNVQFASAIMYKSPSAVKLTNLDLTNVDFSGAIFCVVGYGSKVAKSDFSGCVLKNTNFTSAILSAAQASVGSDSYCSAISVDFSNLDLSSCIFDKAVLSQSGAGAYYGIKPYASSVKFENAKLSGASFKDSILASVGTSSNGTGISSSAVDFSNLDLSDCDFTGATMSAFGGGNMSYVSASVNMTGANLTNAKLDNINLSAHATDTGVNFSNANLTSASLRGCSVTKMVQFDNAIITNADFSNVTGLTTSQLSQTASYKNKDLSGVKFNGLDLTNWILRGQNLQNTSFNGANLTGVNARYADLRGSDLTGITGSLKTQNTIWADGEIKNFTMESVDDSLTIRAYVPATSGGAMINAKIVDDASISGGAVLTLEQGAVLEIASGKTLSVLDNSEIIFNVDAAASDSTKILLGENSKLVFGSDSKIIVNLDGVISPDDSYALSVIEVAADACISVADAISKDNLVLYVNAEAYDSDKWGFNFDPTTGLTINVNVPEPTTVAAIFGALALAFAVYRRRR